MPEKLEVRDRALPITNPDLLPSRDDLLALRSEFLPKRLHSLLDQYTFRRCRDNEILASRELTKQGWPGMEETTAVDLISRDLINSPMCGVFDVDNRMVAYSRLLWGIDNAGNMEIHSHMTTVLPTTRDGGIGEALKWFARQIALTYPNAPVDQLTVTFDNMQSRNCHINFNKLGIICGYAGGRFIRNTYTEIHGRQHIGNPTDRYSGRWLLNSPWTVIHLYGREKRLVMMDISEFPVVLSSNLSSGIPEPYTIDLTQDNSAFVTLAIPAEWDDLLSKDRESDYSLCNIWRQANREVLEHYFAARFTTVAQVNDPTSSLSYQLLVKDFDVSNPPKILSLD